jgi:CheY-like chemotaxis protein
MDIQMPVMDGFEATNEIRAFELSQGLRPMPIVAMTAYALQGDKDRCLAAGMDEYITKPIREDDLRAVIDRLIFGKAEQDQGSGRSIPELPEPESPQQLQVFDRDGLLARLGGNQELLPKMVGLFISSADEHMKQLRQAAAEADVDQIRAKAHAIKGSAGNVGACTLSDAAAALETAVKNGEGSEQPELLASVEQQYELFRAVAEKINSGN